MKVKRQDSRVWVELETEKEMRIYMHPLRQRILDLLARNPNGMSAKKVADALKIAPSSAGHHLRALQDICLVEEIRTEKIHGFEAKIYGDTHASVHITPKGMDLTPGERTAFLNRELSERAQRFMQAVEQSLTEPGAPAQNREKSPHLSGGICYCSKEEMEELTSIVVQFFETHTHPKEEQHMYEYCFFHFPAEKKAESGER